MKASSTHVASKFNKESGRGSLSRFKLLATSWSKNSMPMLGNWIKRRGSHTPRLQWKASKDYRLDHVLEDLCIIGADWVRHKDGRPHYLRRADLEPMTKEEIIADQIYKFVYKTDVSYSLPFPSIIAALCADARIPAIPDDTLIPQEPPIIEVAMTRTRETRARNPRPARQANPPQQQPPQEQPQPQVHHQQHFPSNFYTHFDASMSQIYRRLDQ
ncbi:hypothetical protein PIB30_096089 [Stylosanthes scabra]|uniref:Uncharacterized protein n=1 Tax=Stylosanthes scabra TaxID=79078 RepID=A0ABU6UX37_9FABA|nr:hypothetical protein [Stylosanthes scabra]